ncbi:MAG: RdgB/HAM1 family non-canonical purine NTP pyrophosphatase [Angelakisella sp.]|jgi:XTP/dITP diphosphohydrolase|nr:RdgB/HAM1 family non-canonical purine NTP pyrophosphatase [Angelakisella sp.]
MKVIAATRNRHKLTEFSRILSPMGYEVVSQEEVCPGIEVEEDGATFLENARKKAVEIFRRTGMPTIADDSGLCVDALNGAPGVHSARYADDEGDGHDDKANNRKLLRELAGVSMEKRTARFVSAISFAIGEGELVECEGFCQGQIAFEALGDNGFGYDPLFLVEGGSFASIPGEEKDRISHRGNALRKLQALLEARRDGAAGR